jgi:hypothetical protein
MIALEFVSLPGWHSMAARHTVWHTGAPELCFSRLVPCIRCTFIHSFMLHLWQKLIQATPTGVHLPGVVTTYGARRCVTAMLLG